MSDYTNLTKMFFTKENMQMILNIFQDYMKEKHNVVFTTSEEIGRLKKQIFKSMTQIFDEAKDNGTQTSINQLNIGVLANIRNILLNETSANKPNIKLLDRDQIVYGQRELKINEQIPQHNPYSKKSDGALPSLEDIMNSRTEKKTVPDISRLGQVVNEKAEKVDDFMSKLKSLENERTITEQAFKSTIPNPTPESNTVNSFMMDLQSIQTPTVDPKEMYTPAFSQMMASSIKTNEINKSDQSLSLQEKENKIGTSSQSILAPIVSKQIQIQKYLSINSFDREWSSAPLRYRYAVTFNGMQSQYKNIKSIQIGRVVIPQEIIENVNILNYPNKTNFNYEFSFSYPYLILRIDEFNDVYDGTNDNVRKSFCHLVYDQSYKSPNGRGYIVLKPIQREKKEFYPTPLSSLSKLTLSILRPNGQLLNDSSDGYKVFKVDYEPFNPNYLQIVTDTFFDKNEFFVGDNVVIKGYNMSSKDMCDFINRPEGHEIVQIGSTNDNGFYRNFYIYAPGTFDKSIGKFVVKQSVIAELNSYNNTIDFTTSTATNGYIMNFSLQNSIAISIDVVTGDSSSAFK